MGNILLVLLIIIGIVNIIIAISNKRRESKVLENKLEKGFENSEKLIKDEFQRSRLERNINAKEDRNELNKNLNTFAETNKANNKDLNEIIRQKFDDFNKYQETQSKRNEEQLKEIKLSIEKQLISIREDNTKQLDEMRKTVDEKLQKTLNERLSQSFETVGKQLIAVQEGLGEMKNIANDVGGLKKVLSNVKMRGGIGEIQLSMLLEQILAPEQYESNVKTKSNSNDLVEFAIKLPGKNNNDAQVWLPIDAKFPRDVYEQVQDAYEIGNIEQINTSLKNLENTIKQMAKDISSKYLEPPFTTDFGIMFLPFEGIYAEVVRKASLLEELQNKYKIIVTGPSTLAAILNSLQMGFRTLAIQKRSSEVWEVLGAVKTEFENFGGLMDKAQKNIQTGLNQLDEVVGKRTRAIQRKLKGVEALDKNNTELILETSSLNDDKFNEEDV